MTAKPILYLGNRNYSSWSLRAYLALAAAEIEFDEVVIPLDSETSKDELRDVSPNGKVPALRVGAMSIWESLAIAEWAAEKAPSLWPADESARAHARSIASEMHAGFAGLRRDMPMNIRGRFPGVGHSREALADAGRVLAIWQAALTASGGPFLFGSAFGVADAMYAPVATRFVTYGVALDRAAPYVEALHAYPAMARWTAAAAAEPWQISISEPSSPRWAGGPLA